MLFGVVGVDGVGVLDVLGVGVIDWVALVVGFEVTAGFGTLVASR